MTPAYISTLVADGISYIPALHAGDVKKSTTPINMNDVTVKLPFSGILSRLWHEDCRHRAVM
jgi:hypothetical protein